MKTKREGLRFCSFINFLITYRINELEYKFVPHFPFFSFTVNILAYVIN